MNDHQRLNLFAHTRDLSVLKAIYENQVGKLKEWLDRQYNAIDAEGCIAHAFVEVITDPAHFAQGLPSLWSCAANHALRQRDRLAAQEAAAICRF